ncbi:Oidioi.mRNA.OKI2018_I69.XSR.g16719.t1.cds [Oikopleura dioica]|uniref:Large ribosomal subunit protein eL6 n=1 Tax=Oikopleura dioica TaxID=34765 RepID=A0ABN7SIW7_OIKDI|nr:Oidioi.mRNA.OKI2018_I69.XSR.g16719.t1.cds [Oikopleura dioica]
MVFRECSCSFNAHASKKQQMSLPESRTEKGDQNEQTPFFKKKKKKNSDPAKSFSEKKRDSCSLESGQILILLTGRHRGKRVVFIKQMRQSGLLLITGPYSLNGVPLRRVHQKTTITTTTSLPLSTEDFQVPPFVDDSYFCTKKKPKATLESVLEDVGDKEKDEVSEERKSLQRKVDEAVLDSIKRIPYMGDYLSQKFSLSKGQMPHKMNF